MARATGPGARRHCRRVPCDRRSPRLTQVDAVQQVNAIQTVLGTAVMAGGPAVLALSARRLPVLDAD